MGRAIGCDRCEADQTSGGEMEPNCKHLSSSERKENVKLVLGICLFCEGALFGS